MEAVAAYDGKYKETESRQPSGPPQMPGCVLQKLSPVETLSSPLHLEHYLTSDPNLFLWERGRSRAINKQCK